MVTDSSRIEKIHNAMRTRKDALLWPLTMMFHKLGATAHMLSNAKLFFSLTLFFFFPNLLIATIIITLLALLDALDGSLARLQKSVSDRGHFLDGLSDHILTVIIVFCLMYYGFTDANMTAYHLLIFPIANLLAAIVYNEKRKSDWIIHPAPNLGYLKVPFIFFLYLFLLFNLNYLNETLFYLNILYTILSLFFILYIQYRWKKKSLNS